MSTFLVRFVKGDVKVFEPISKINIEYVEAINPERAAERFCSRYLTKIAFPEEQRSTQHTHFDVEVQDSDGKIMKFNVVATMTVDFTAYWEPPPDAAGPDVR